MNLVPNEDVNQDGAYQNPDRSSNGAGHSSVHLDELLLKKHAHVVMEALGAAVECLEDSVFLSNVLVALGQIHATYHVKPMYLPVRFNDIDAQNRESIMTSSAIRANTEADLLHSRKPEEKHERSHRNSDVYVFCINSAESFIDILTRNDSTRQSKGDQTNRTALCLAFDAHLA